MDLQKDRERRMKIIVDTNIIISYLLSADNVFRKILARRQHEYYSCNFSVLEIFTHKEKILKFSRMSESDILESLHQLLREIHLVNEQVIADNNLLKAYELCEQIDKKDIPFVALALELDALLWTGDKKLKQGLQQKGFNRFFEIETS